MVKVLSHHARGGAQRCDGRLCTERKPDEKEQTDFDRRKKMTEDERHEEDIRMSVLVDNFICVGFICIFFLLFVIVFDIFAQVRVSGRRVMTR